MVFQGAGSIVNSGSIYGGRWGVTSRGLFTVTNSGTISGGSQGIVLSGGGFINNSNLISGADGIGIGGGVGTVNNTGTIVSYGAGVALNSGGIVSNSGTGLISITGAYGAVYITGGAGTVTNGGTLAGYIGVQFVGAYNNTLIDTGTIIGSSGTAVAFGSGNDLLKFTPSTSIDIEGTADGGGGANTFEFASGASAGTLTGNGANFVNFGSGTVDAGATWVLAGTNTFGAGVTLTNSGTLTDAGTLLNAGRIVGGITLANGAKFTNQSGGTIIGSATGISESGVATLTNAGSIGGNATSGIGIYLRAGGTLTNQSGGTIGGGADAVKFAAGFTNRLMFNPGAGFSGTVDGGNTIGATAVSTLELTSGVSTGTIAGLGSHYIDFAQITVDSAASWVLSGSNTVVTGETLTLNNAKLSTAGTLVNSGTLQIGTGTLTVGNLLGTSSATIGAAGTLSVSGTVASGQTIDFAGTAALLALGTPGSASGTLAGFVAGDTIELVGINNVTRTDLVSGNTLQISLGTGGPIDLHLSGSYTGDYFHFTNTGSNSFITENTTPCYLAGTRIRTDRGEIPVEDLRMGDRVMTLSGEAKPIKWIGKRAYASAFAAGNRDVIPILIRANALGAGVPSRDLYVSPLHAMFFDDVLIQAEHLVNGASIVRCPDIDPIRYFHIELEQHDIIFAEGAPAETFVDCDSRGMFHNAAEFALLYPAGDTAKWQFCAPRIESGPILDQVRHAIDARAGLRDAAAASAIGPLHGNLDGVEGTSIVGWAFDPTLPDKPVTLELLDGEGLIARVTANRYRGDLEAAGIGDGRHGFELRLARSLSPMTRHEIRLRRVADGRELPGSPLVIEPHSDRALLKDARLALDTAIGVASDAPALDAVLATLLDRVGTVRRLRSALRPPAGGDDRLVSWAKGGRARPKRALVIDDRIPRRDRDAGSNAVLGHIEAMRALGWEVELVASHELARADEAVAAMQAWGVRCHQAPQAYSVEEVLRHNRNSFDLVYLHRLSNAETYATMVRQWQPRARVIYSLADLHHVRLGRQAAIQGNDEQLEASVRLKARELAAMRLADAVITHSPEEAAYLAREAPGANVHVVPWAVTPKRRTVALRHRADIAFIGGYRHAPNADAVRWLSEAVMPLVWQRDPDMACLIVGPDWPDKLAGATDPRLRFVGQVLRLEEIFDTVRLTVAPLRFGAGLKGKVLDSLAAGLPCVMTPLAAEGLPLSGVLRGLVAETPDGLAELICDLHHQSGLNRSRADAGLAMIGRHYNEDAVRDALARAIEGQAVAVPASAVKPAAKRLPVVVWSTPVTPVARRQQSR